MAYNRLIMTGQDSIEGEERTLQINVAQLLKSPLGSTRDYQVSGLVNVADSNLLVEGVVGLIRTGRSILVKGRLDTRVELMCSRCLNLFSCPLTLHIEEEFFPTIDIITGAPLSLSGEPDAFTIDEHNVLGLTEASRQYALLAIPMKPLCREDCAGLCPSCGANLNQVACGCLPKSVDPRWSELNKLVLTSNQSSVNKPKGTKLNR